MRREEKETGKREGERRNRERGRLRQVEEKGEEGEMKKGGCCKRNKIEEHGKD